MRRQGSAYQPDSLAAIRALATFLLLAMPIAWALATQREMAQREAAAHPERGWPRGSGHVVYAWPGTAEEQKSYVEPGGSFSPVPRSFGLSIEDGDRIPLSQIKQRFAWISGEPMPVLVTETPRYHANLLSDRPAHWTILITGTASQSVTISVRSVGPAGGPIFSLKNVRGRLLISDRWVIRLDPPPVSARISEEGPHSEGWYRADVQLAKKTTVEINDLKFGKVPVLPFATTRAITRLDTADPQFRECLDDQVAHLMMSLVADQTRPGDPLNYPLAWLRDGAYVVVALARAGQVDTAKQLALYFADHDFFGGFGAEADAPGLALWAIGETAGLAHSVKFDERVWEAVRRKAELIHRMHHATATIRHSFDGPAVPAHNARTDLDLVSDATQNGLIIGRTDWHRPVLFVNAVSFMGLNEAARIADRRGRGDLAMRWRQEAVEIRVAWERALNTNEALNERTYISALWPTHIGDQDKAKLRALFEARWAGQRTPDGGFKKLPQWTYFDIAEAHNWLELGDRARAEQTMHWFWHHQASPGLYTWWEGSGRENSFHRWNDVRGWVHPGPVTPHYWTAAEMLLLQLDLAGVR
jgi:hypothetical protein